MKRVHLMLSDEEDAELDEIAGILHDTRTQIIRNALKHYAHMVHRAKEGAKTLYIQLEGWL